MFSKPFQHDKKIDIMILYTHTLKHMYLSRKTSQHNTHFYSVQIDNF